MGKTMPKLTINAFIDKHRTGTCVLFQFFDYKIAKDRARKAKQPFTGTDGKTIPTPMQVVTKLVPSFAKGDYAIQSDGEDKRMGVKLHVIFSDPAEALRLAKIFHPAAEMKHFKQTLLAPCATGVNVPVADSDHFRIAKQLGLF
jgi:hypothetical protein